jgi:4-hydroxy-tetrahydrodipicolinate reductase
MTQTTLSIALVGAAGRMGREITRAAEKRNDLRVTAGLEHSGSPVIGRDPGEWAGVAPTGVAITDDLEAGFNAADLVIDLSLPEATENVVRAACKTGKPLVCGTTGLAPAQLAAFDRAAAEIPILYTPNLSLGIAVVSALTERAAKALGKGYDIEIVETHHRKKVDAPSGTALALADSAAKGAGLDPSAAVKLGRAGHTGERPEAEIGVHAIRGGGVFGEHTVAFLGDHERVEITHSASSRVLFAEGALRAALFLAGKPPGRYTMADLLDF